MDKARDDYSSALETFNKTQTLYYDADFPQNVNVRFFSMHVSTSCVKFGIKFC